MNLSLTANTTVGFLGAGQLARMSAAEAFRMGIKTAVYPGRLPDNKKTVLEPLELMTSVNFPGSFEDEQSLTHFAEHCDVITLENEFLDGALLAHIAQNSGTPLYPSPETFKSLETKWLEKETFRRAGIPVTPSKKVINIDDLNAFAESYGYPFILKSSKGGYDGYGNVTINKAGEHRSAFQKLGGDLGRELIAETFINFEKELAVQVARNHTGTVVYPCCETIQQNHICKTVFAPAPIEKKYADQACQIAVAATEAIDGIGLFAFEFFLTSEGDLLLNESAPRPHNSGHYTIEGCISSQFENHIRAILGLPLGSTEMRRPVAIMENLLGTHNRTALLEGAESIWPVKDAHLHIYGKQKSRSGRKMGHLTVLGDHFEEVRGLTKQLSEAVSI